MQLCCQPHRQCTRPSCLFGQQLPRSLHGRMCRASAASSSTAASNQLKPPRAKNKVRLDKLFLDTHEEMMQRNLPVLHVKMPLSFTDAYYVRDPEAIWFALSKDDVLFAKSPRVAQSKEWLGEGVFTQLDADKHAAARATLNPAFRRDYLQQLDGFMIASAEQLAELLIDAAGAGAAGADTGAVAGSDPAHGSAAALVAPLDMQRLFRLLTLDTIGVTSLNQSFDTIKLWRQQQQQQQPQASSTPAPAEDGSNTSSSSSSADSQLELEQMLMDLEAAFLLQSLQLPVPRSWLPGWEKYTTACTRLNATIENILQQTKAQQSGSQSLNNPSTGHDSSGRQTLVSFLLAAQQRQGADSITDTNICDEIKTIMFGGTDTSAFTLAMCAYYLAQHPAAAERAAAEVAALLQQTGRTKVSQLTAADTGKLPWVTALVNETMRLAPAGPVITRIALQDTELAGYSIRKGALVALHVYAVHRHPDIWPEADAWLPQRWLSAEASAQGLSTRSLPDSRAQPFLPFSTGPRGCIGRNYAMLQMVLTLAVLLGSGIRFKLPTGYPPVELVKSMTMHAKHGVWLTPNVQL